MENTNGKTGQNKHRSVDGEAHRNTAHASATQFDRRRNDDLWDRIVNAMPETHFAGSNSGVLVRHLAQADRVAMLIERAANSKGKFSVDDYASLLRAQASESGIIVRLARSMRLTQQAIYEAKRAANRPITGPVPWEESEEEEA